MYSHSKRGDQDGSALDSQQFGGLTTPNGSDLSRSASLHDDGDGVTDPTLGVEFLECEMGDHNTHQPCPTRGWPHLLPWGDYADRKKKKGPRGRWCNPCVRVCDTYKGMGRIDAKKKLKTPGACGVSFKTGWELRRTNLIIQEKKKLSNRVRSDGRAVRHRVSTVGVNINHRGGALAVPVLGVDAADESEDDDEFFPADSDALQPVTQQPPPPPPPQPPAEVVQTNVGTRMVVRPQGKSVIYTPEAYLYVKGRHYWQPTISLKIPTQIS